jgi:hypothetical protein
MPIYKPREDDLAPLLQEATVRANQTVEEWIPKFLAAVKRVLGRNLLRYRGYGPYWWLIKKALIDREDLGFGEHIDLEWFEAMDYGKPEINLLAAWAYDDQRFNVGLMSDPYHTLEDLEGEMVEYISNDEEMEALAVARVMDRK